MTGLPYLPNKNFEITFLENPIKSVTNGRIDKYVVTAIVETDKLIFGPMKWRTSNRFLWHEFDRIHSKIGTLFNVTLRVTNKWRPVKIINNPNLPLFDMESLRK